MFGETRVRRYLQLSSPAVLAAAIGLLAWGVTAQTIATAADAAAGAMTPAARVASTPKDGLKNPYNPSDADVVAQGRELFQNYSCAGCHGGSGGGGLCPQVNGDVWFYGMGDDVLFRLVTLGSVELQKTGFERSGGPGGSQMPPFGGIIKSDDELWKILTWIRSVYKGDPKKKFW